MGSTQYPKMDPGALSHRCSGAVSMEILNMTGSSIYSTKEDPCRRGPSSYSEDAKWHCQAGSHKDYPSSPERGAVNKMVPLA